MADIELSYKGAVIGSLTGSGSLTMQTSGKYCEDDITLAYTSPGGGSLPAVGAAIWGTIASSSYVTLGNGAKTEYGISTDMFSYSSGILTCLYAGSYTAYLCSRGGYNNQGAARYAHFKLVVNGVDVLVHDTNDSGNAGFSMSHSLTLSVNDTVKMMGKTNSGTNTSDYSIIIVKTS